MHGRATKWTRGAALALACASLAALSAPASGAAATREPISESLAALDGDSASFHGSAQPDPRAMRALRSSAPRQFDGGEEVKISSTYFGAAEMAAVAATLRRLDHGPELAQLSVYLATPAEIEQACGATVVACYAPARMEMVVAGEDRTVAGVPRDFAIAHEYGHHIANTQQGDLAPAVAAGTIRWATYERVCQFSRARELFPGDQGAHYWENPDEAFAESYAHLNEPGAAVSWQFTSLLQPSLASLEKIRADVARPWRGPVSATWRDSVRAAPPARSHPSAQGTGRAGLSGATVVGEPPWIASRLVRTPLDGNVAVHLQASPGASYAVVLRDAGSGRLLSRASTGEAGSADLSYGNCGRSALRLEVRSLAGPGGFEATVARP